MSGHRLERITEDIKRELTAIVKVEVTGDLSLCKVYVSAIDGMEKAKEAVLGLKFASGYIRHELGLRLKLRHVPAPIFIATDSIEYGTDILKKLSDLRK